MANGFVGGFQAGQQVPSTNPFGAILKEVNSVTARRRAEDKAREAENRKFQGVLTQMGSKFEFDKKLAEHEATLERKTATQKASQAQAFLKEIGMGGSFAPGTNISIPGPGGTKITSPLARKFTGEEVKSLSTAEQLTTEIGDLKALISGPKAFKAQFAGSLPFGLGTTVGQSFKLLKDSVGERLLRLRSGAQINEQEFKRFMKLLPAFTRKDVLDIKQLERFEDEFNSIRGRILSGAKFDKDKGTFSVPEGQIPGAQGESISVTPEQKAQFNKLRSQGMSSAEARKEVGF